jgi:RNA polymerase sigma-70 factor (ECF subfamily)
MQSWSDVMEVVVRERRAALIGYAYLITGSLSEAEDITQEAIVRTFVRGQSRTDLDYAEAYIRKAIVNEAINRSRHRRLTLSRRAAIAQPESAPGHDGWVAAHADVAEALAALSTQERACVVLRYFEDMTVPEIAGALRLAEGTVKRYLFNAADKLRGFLDDQAVDDPGELASVSLNYGGRS